MSHCCSRSADAFLAAEAGGVQVRIRVSPEMLTCGLAVIRQDCLRDFLVR